MGKIRIHHKFGNGLNPTYENGDDWGDGLLLFYPHYSIY